MKTIIKPASPSFLMKCDKCDCEFTYQIEDIAGYCINSTLYVTCPACGNDCLHSCRVKNYMEEMGTELEIKY